MADANNVGAVRVATWMLGPAVVLMAIALLVEPARFLALPSYMLRALGLMVLAWAAPESQWVRDRPWVRRVGAGLMLLVGIGGALVLGIAVVSAGSLVASAQATGWNVLGWLVVYSPIVGAALVIGVAGWRLIRLDRHENGDQTQPDHPREAD